MDWDKEDDIEEEKTFVINAMKVFGGSFALALASLIQRADLVNLRKIKQTFHEEWEQYLVMGKQLGVRK